MRTRTRDTSENGYHFMSGLLRLESERNLANISRATGVNDQALQHFMSESPWSGEAVIEQVQVEVAARAELASGGMLLLDESGEVKGGTHTVGAARQYLGSVGKVELGQVGVFVALAKGPYWSWVDGELYLPEIWFSAEYAERRTRVELPTERCFATKAELGLQLIERVRAHQVPFEAIGCDAFYGRDGAFRAELEGRQLEYMADIPANLRVYLSQPVIGLPAHVKGRPAIHERVLSPKAQRVDQLRTDPATRWQSVTVRPTERGCLTADFAARRVWTVWQDASEQFHVRQEWLVIRRDADRTCSYSLSNAPTNRPLASLAARKSQRFFVEAAIRDAKSDLGWDECQTIKFRAWHHQLALTILASWFIAETKLDWSVEYARDPALFDYYQVEVLPALSVANVRSLLRAVLPLPQLSTAQAVDLVIQHLDNRVRSRRSRLKNRSGP